MAEQEQGQGALNFGGLFQALVPPRVRRARVDEANAETNRIRVDYERRAKDLEYQGKVRDSINSAFESLGHPEDKALLDATLDSIFKSVEQTSGKKVNPLLVRFFKANPQDAKQIMDSVAEQGITMSDLFNMTGDPMLTAAGLTAFGKNRRQRKASEAAGTTPESTVEQPQPTGQPATTPDPTAGIRARIAALQGQRATVLQNESNAPRITALTKGIDEELKTLQDQLGKFTTDVPIKVAEEARAPADNKAVDEARIDAKRAGVSDAVAARMFSYGMPRGELARRKTDFLGAPAPATPATAGAETATPGASATSLATTAEARAVEDSRVSTRLATRDRAVEEVNAKRLGEWQTAAESQRKRRPARDTMEKLLAEMGPTGQLVGPIREGFNNIAQLFGVEKPTKLNEIQLFDRLNKNLVTETLRDFSGPDSDRDVLRAMEINPGIRNTRAANSVLLAIAKAEDTFQQDRLLNARRWVTQFGSLAAKDPSTGKNFDEGWEAHIAKQPSVGRVMAEKLGLKIPKVR